FTLLCSMHANGEHKNANAPLRGAFLRCFYTIAACSSSSRPPAMQRGVVQQRSICDAFAFGYTHATRRYRKVDVQTFQHLHDAQDDRLMQVAIETKIRTRDRVPNLQLKPRVRKVDQVCRTEGGFV